MAPKAAATNMEAKIMIQKFTWIAWWSGDDASWSDANSAYV